MPVHFIINKSINIEVGTNVGNSKGFAQTTHPPLQQRYNSGVDAKVYYKITKILATSSKMSYAQRILFLRKYLKDMVHRIFITMHTSNEIKFSSKDSNMCSFRP